MGSRMNVILVKAVVALVPTSVLLAWSIAVFSRSRTLGSWLQLCGAISLVVVVLTHFGEGLHMLDFMD